MILRVDCKLSPERRKSLFERNTTMPKTTFSQSYSGDESKVEFPANLAHKDYKLVHSHPPAKECTQQDRPKIAACMKFFRSAEMGYVDDELKARCGFAADEDEELLNVLKDEHKIELAKAEAQQIINVTCAIS